MTAWTRWLKTWGRKARTRRTSSIATTFVPNCVRLEGRDVPATFPNGVTVATGDFNLDGKLDVLVGSGPSRATTRVVAYSGVDGSVLQDLTPYGRAWRGGAFVAAGDFNGDGADDIVIGAGKGGTAHVRIINGLTGESLFDQNVFGKNFTGGVRVAAADVNADGRDDLIVGAGAGGAPEVRVYDGKTLTLIRSFSAYDPTFKGGVFVAAGDTNGDGSAEIITGAGAGGGPQVNVFNFPDGKLTRSFMAFDPAFKGGVHVSAVNVAGTGRTDIVTGAGEGGGPQVAVYSGPTGDIIRSLYAYDPKFAGGAFVAGGDYNGDGVGDILTGAGPGGDPHVILYSGKDYSYLTTFYAFEGTGAPRGFGTPTTPSVTPNTDTTIPTLSITSPASGVTVRTNQAVTGTASDNAGIARVEYQLDSGSFVTVPLTNGSFSFTTTFKTDGTQDGSRVVRVRAVDTAGNVSAAQAITINLDTTVVAPDFTLDDLSDSGNKGDYLTGVTTISITGKTDPNASVKLSTNNALVNADSAGQFKFTGIPLTDGQNSLTITATDSLGNVNQFTRVVTLDRAPTVSAAIADSTVAANAGATTINLASKFADADVSNSIVKIATNQGNLQIRLFDQQAPLNVNNFLAYLTSGKYTNAIFHRSVDNFVIQSGGFQYTANPSALPSITVNAAVQDEIGISNTRGTLAFAKPSTQLPGGGSTPTPNSATSQFFVNLSNTNTFLDPNFTVFGELADAASLETADRINAIQPQNQGQPFDEIPLTNYTGDNFPTDTTRENFVIINSADIAFRSDQLTFSVTSNSNSNLVTAAVVGNKLTLTYAANQSGVATVTVRATDRDGRFVEDTFQVTVGTPTDTTAPALTVSAPTTGLVGNTNPTVTGNAADEAGGSGLATVTVQVDGGTASTVTVDNAGNFSLPLSFATDGSQDGTHTITVTATDKTGNAATPITRTFTLDTVQPALAVTAPASGLNTNANVTVTGTATDTGGSGVASVSVQIDGGAALAATVDASGNFALPTTFDTDGTDDGTHTLTITATDTAGNSKSDTRTFTLDATAPALTVTSPASGTTTNTNPTVTGTATDTGGTGVTGVTAQVDGGPAVAATLDANGNFTFTSSLATDGSADGSHSIVIRSVDAAGNVSVSQAILFTLDTTGPTTPTLTLDPASDSAPTGDNDTNVQTVRVNGVTDPNTNVTLTNTSGAGATAFTDAGGNFFFSGIVLAVGQNTITVEANDALGNVSTSSVVITYTP